MVLNTQKIRKHTLELRTIDHSIRQSIIRLLYGRELTVTEIYIELRLDQTVASQHLARLKKHGFVKDDRKGKYVFYSLTDKINQYADSNETKLAR